MHTLVVNTIAVLTVAPQQHAEWHASMVRAVVDARQRGPDWQIEVDFFDAILALLNGQAPTLRPDHPYAAALQTIRDGVAAGASSGSASEGGDAGDDPAVSGRESAVSDLPIAPDLLARAIAALLASPPERLVLAQELAPLVRTATDSDLQAFYNALLSALFGSDLAALGSHFSGAYEEAWNALRLGVELDGIAPQVFQQLVDNTRQVLGPRPGERTAWHAALVDLHAQVGETKPGLAALLDTILILLDAGGDPAGLGAGLTGIYARVWQAITQPPSAGGIA